MGRAGRAAPSSVIGPRLHRFSLLGHGLCETLCLATSIRRRRGVAADSRNKLSSRVAVYHYDNLDGIGPAEKWNGGEKPGISSRHHRDLRGHIPNGASIGLLAGRTHLARRSVCCRRTRGSRERSARDRSGRGSRSCSAAWRRAHADDRFFNRVMSRGAPAQDWVQRVQAGKERFRLKYGLRRAASPSMIAALSRFADARAPP